MPDYLIGKNNLDLPPKCMAADTHRKKLKLNLRLSEQVAERESLSILSCLPQHLLCREALSKSAFHFTTDLLWSETTAQTGNSLTFIYLVFSPYLLMMAEQISVWTQHLCFHLDHMVGGRTCKYRLGGRKIDPCLQDANCRMKLFP